MPSGLEHATMTKRALVPISIGAGVLFYSYSMTAGLGLMTGSLLGLALTPDIDSPAQSYEETRIIRWNKTIGKTYSAFWSFYESIHPHRGVSHWPFIGTAGRFLYLFIVIRLFIYLLGGMCYDVWGQECSDYLLATHPFSLLLQFPEFFIWVYIGQSIPDLIHIYADNQATRRKRKGRGRGRGWS